MRLSGWFIIDLFCSLPFLLDIFMGSDGVVNNFKAAKILKVARILRGLKFLKASRITKATQKSAVREYINDLVAMYINGQMLRQAVLATTVLVIAHWLSCLWVALDVEAGSEDVTWYTVAQDENDVRSRCRPPSPLAPEPAPYGISYLSSFIPHLPPYTLVHMPADLGAMYFVITTMTTVGYGDVTPTSDTERAIAIISMIIGGVTCSYLCLLLLTLTLPTPLCVLASFLCLISYFTARSVFSFFLVTLSSLIFSLLRLFLRPSVPGYRLQPPTLSIPPSLRRPLRQTLMWWQASHPS